MSDSKPLAGLEVVDLTQGLAGPYCAMLLAQHGARVIKVEPPSGDWSRTLGRDLGDDLTAAFLACNRGKEDIVLDLKSDDDLATLHALARNADVFMESNRPGIAERLGVGYEDIRAINSNIIYLSVSGFGQDGPYSDRPVTDAIMQAFSGFMTRNPDADDRPKRVEFAIPDYTTGLMAYQAVSTALLGRARGAHGARHLDVSLMSAMLAFQQATIIDYDQGNHSVGTPVPPTGTYQTADGLMNISVVRDKNFENLCEALGLAALTADQRFKTIPSRRAHEAELIRLLEPAFADKTNAELESAFRKFDVPHGRVNRYEDVLADPHVAQTKALTWAKRDGLGRFPVFRLPGAVPLEANDTRHHAPNLNESNVDIRNRLNPKD
ncbi:MAG: CoA transferase [Gammaproteobacteria bacterium]|nr:CoA transferase [Gammaproteobacteria bacterium]